MVNVRTGRGGINDIRILRPTFSPLEILDLWGLRFCAVSERAVCRVKKRG